MDIAQVSRPVKAIAFKMADGPPPPYSLYPDINEGRRNFARDGATFADNATSQPTQKPENIVEREKVEASVEDQVRLLDKFSAAIRTIVIEVDMDGNDTYEAQIPEPASETCQWILDQEKFNSWLGDKPSLLMIVADPGLGKSVLARSIIEKIRKSKQRVLGFFCKSENRNRDSVSSIIASFLSRILQVHGELIRYLTFDDMEGGVTFERLWDFFIKVCGDPQARKFSFVIDALDECLPEDQNILYKALIKAKEEFRAKILITSRPNAISEAIGSLYSTILLLPADLEREVNYYVASELKNRGLVGIWSTATTNLFQKALESGADGMFLWVSFVLEEVERRQNDDDFEFTTNSIRDFLSKPPPKLVDFYGAMIKSIPLRRRENVAKILSILLVAQWNLSGPELAFALVLGYTDNTPSSHTDLEGFIAHNMARRARMLCGSLVRTQDDTVCIVHQSARDYLESLATRQVEVGDWDSLPRELDIPSAHHRLARACLRYLTMDMQISEATLGDLFERLPFLLYAVIAWPVHVAKAGHLILQDRGLLQQFLDVEALPYKRWSIFHWLLYRSGEGDNEEVFNIPPLLHTLARFGLENLLVEVISPPHNALLDLSVEIDKVDSKGNTALLIAIYIQHVAIVERLLSSDADPNTSNIDGLTPLILATLMENAQIVKLLIERGASLETRFKDFGDAAFIAVGLNNTGIAQLILDRLTKPAFQELDGWTILHEAAKNGNEQLTLRLLGMNYDIFAKSHDGWQPIHAAASSGSLLLVSILHNHGVDLNARANNGYSPLMCASESKCLPLVEFLILHGADVNASAEGWTALMIISNQDSEDIEMIKTLLNLGADFERKNFESETALSFASYQGFSATVEVLLLKGTFINSQNTQGRTALIAACSGGHYQTVKNLLSATPPPDLNIVTKAQISALHMAIFKGHINIVELLLDAGANIDLPALETRMTPLYIACWRRQDAIAAILIRRGADINCTTKIGRLPLHASAEEGGNIKLNQLLISHGQSINAVDDNGVTAVHIAASAGNLEVLKLFLAQPDVNPATETKRKHTPLFDCISNNHLECAQLLFPWYEDFDLQTAGGWTLLHATTKVGMKEMFFKILPLTNWWIRNRRCITPLHCAAQYGFTDLAKTLLLAGMPVSIANATGLTPLHLACSSGQKELAMMLLEEGADPECRTDQNESPIYFAAASGNLELVKHLIDLGADLDVRACRMQVSTPYLLGCVTDTPNMLQLFHQCRPGKSDTDASNGSPLHYAAIFGKLKCLDFLLKESQEDLEQLWYPDASTAMTRAATVGQKEAVRRLFAAGADPIVADDFGMTTVDWINRDQSILEEFGARIDQYQTKSNEESKKGILRMLKKILLTISLSKNNRWDKLRVESLWGATPFCFFRLDDDDAALTVLERSLTRGFYDNFIDELKCHYCQKSSTESHFRNRRYPIVACEDCKSKVRDLDFGLTPEEFIEFPRPTWFTLNKGAVNSLGQSENQWLTALMEKYQVSEDDKEVFAQFGESAWAQDRSLVISELCQNANSEGLRDHLRTFPIDVSCYSPEGITPVLVVVNMGHDDAVTLKLLRVLSDSGADMLAMDQDMHSALVPLTKSSRSQSLIFLLQHYDVFFDEENQEASSIIKWAISKQLIDLIDIIVQRHFIWITKSELEWVKELIDAGIDDELIKSAIVEFYTQPAWKEFSQPELRETLDINYHQPFCCHKSIVDARSKPPIQSHPTSLTTQTAHTQKLMMEGSDHEKMMQTVASFCCLGGLTYQSALDEHISKADFRPQGEVHLAWLEDIDEGAFIRSLVNATDNIIAAAAAMQHLGFCCDSFSFIVVPFADDSLRLPESNSVMLSKVTFEKLNDFSNALKAFQVAIQDEDGFLELSRALNKATGILTESGLVLPSKLGQLQGQQESARYKLHLLSLTVQILSLALLSYANGHIAQLWPFFLREPLQKIYLEGRQSVESRVCVQRLTLACLGDMLQADILAFSWQEQETLDKNQQLPNLHLDFDWTSKFHILATAEDVLDVFGPGTMIFNPKLDHQHSPIAIELGGGCLTIAPKSDEDTFRRAHWTVELLDYSIISDTFTLDELLLIGGPTKNGPCTFIADDYRMNMGESFVRLNTHPTYYTMVSKQASIAAGQYVTLSAGITRGKVSKPLKPEIIHQMLMRDHLALQMPWGLLVSACSGVVQRVTLQEVIVRQLPVYIPNMSPIAPVTRTGLHENLRKLVEALNSNTFSDWIDEVGSGALGVEYQNHAYAALYYCLEILRLTGFQHGGNRFRIAWPGNADHDAAIEIPSTGTNAWTKILQDTESCATFAIMTSDCLLDQRDQCRGGPGQWKNSMGPFYTNVHLDLHLDIPAVPLVDWQLEDRGKYWIARNRGIGIFLVTVIKSSTSTLATLQVSYMPALNFFFQYQYLRERQNITYNAEEVLIKLQRHFGSGR